MVKSPPGCHSDNFNESQTYGNDESNQEEQTATDDKLPQNVERSNRDMTAAQNISRHHFAPITSTRQKSKQEIRMALQALYSEAIGTHD